MTSQILDCAAPSASGLSIDRYVGTADEWNTFATTQEGGTFCHLAGWREIMSDVLGHDCPYLIARDQAGRVRGVLPMARVKSPLFGDYLVSMPFLNYGGAVGTPVARVQLERRAQALAESWRVKLLELRSREAPEGVEPGAHRKVIVLLPLPETPERLWSGFGSKLRSQIRRPMKEEMEVRFGADQREPFYEVFRRNMHALGTPVLPAALFAALDRVFAHTVVFGAVYWRGEPVAGGCGFLWQGEFEMTWASSLREHNSRAPNMLLYWSFMEHVLKRGARVFNFGRCTPGGGTHRFKLQWGAETLPLPWLTWSQSGADATPNPDRPVYRLATRAWSRLPAVIADHMGPMLARNIP